MTYSVLKVPLSPNQPTFHTWLFLLNYSIYLVSPDGVAPSQMVGVSASLNVPLHHKVQKFSSGTGSPGWSQKRAVK